MSGGDGLRQAYFDLLMGQISNGRYPSPTMMDRIEAAVGDRESAENYVQALIDLSAGERFPSPMMLDRLNRLIDVLEPRQVAGQD